MGVIIKIQICNTSRKYIIEDVMKYVKVPIITSSFFRNYLELYGFCIKGTNQHFHCVFINLLN